LANGNSAQPLLYFFLLMLYKESPCYILTAVASIQYSMYSFMCLFFYQITSLNTLGKHVLGTPTMYIWCELFNYNSKLHRKKNTNYKFHIKTTNNSFLFLSWSVVQNIPCKTSLLLHLMHFFFSFMINFLFSFNQIASLTHPCVNMNLN
jgi:hypothetical protein